MTGSEYLERIRPILGRFPVREAEAMAEALESQFPGQFGHFSPYDLEMMADEDGMVNNRIVQSLVYGKAFPKPGQS